MWERPAQGSFLPAESRGLQGLGEVNRRVVHAYGQAKKPGKEVTLDVDAHLVETNKANAEYCYEGYKAYQPMVVCWAETGLVLKDEFRAGNVPASRNIRRIVEPEGILDHWDGRGWEFAVSADMSPQLRGAIEALPEASTLGPDPHA